MYLNDHLQYILTPFLSIGEELVCCNSKVAQIQRKIASDNTSLLHLQSAESFILIPDFRFKYQIYLI